MPVLSDRVEAERRIVATSGSSNDEEAMINNSESFDSIDSRGSTAMEAAGSSRSSGSSSAGPPGWGQWAPALSNFSIQYNYASASLATAVMVSHRDATGDPTHGDFPEPEWAQEWMLSLVFIGSVAGMLCMGLLGDVIGIRRALIVTNTLTVFGALASALLSWGPVSSVWVVIGCGRFVLGVGVGGNYPLSAAKAGAQCHSRSEAVRKAAHAFFWQTPGSIAPYLLGILLFRLPHIEQIVSVQFRLLLGCGAIPALASMLAVLSEPEDAEPEEKPQDAVPSPFKKALGDSRHWRSLVGTAGTWFLFDVAFYGTTIFSPVILAEVFGADMTLTQLSFQAVIMGSVGIFGTAAGVRLVATVGAKTLNTCGLAVAGLLYATFAGLYRYRDTMGHLLFGFLCMLYFVLFMGPNMATYLLPVMAFPKDVRSTFHGLSAAAAKLGAMAGTILFPALHVHYGITTVMGTQAVICFLGALLSAAAVRPMEEEEEEEDGEASATLRSAGMRRTNSGKQVYQSCETTHPVS